MTIHDLYAYVYLFFLSVQRSGDWMIDITLREQLVMNVTYFKSEEACYSAVSEQAPIKTRSAQPQGPLCTLSREITREAFATVVTQSRVLFTTRRTEELR